MQLRDLRSFLHAQPREFVVEHNGHVNDLVQERIRRVSHRQHTWNLLDLPNSDVDIYQWSATGESRGFLNNQDQGDIL